MNTDIKDIRDYVVKLATGGLYQRWLDIDAACSYSSMSKNTLMRYVATNEIYGTKKGGKWIIDRLSIDRFMLEDADSLNIKASCF